MRGVIKRLDIPARSDSLEQQACLQLPLPLNLCSQCNRVWDSVLPHIIRISFRVIYVVNIDTLPDYHYHRTNIFRRRKNGRENT